MTVVGCCAGSDVLVGSVLVGFGDWLGVRDGLGASDCVGVGLTADCVGVGLTAERVGVGLTTDRVAVGSTAVRVELGGVLVGESDAVTDGLSAAPSPPPAPQPASRDNVKQHSKVQGAARRTTANLRPQGQVCTTMPSPMRLYLTRCE